MQPSPTETPDARPAPARPRILLVDDDPGMIRVLARCLAPTAELSFATDGSAALRQALGLRPDLVLLDAEMPGLSGFDVCEALQADPATADIPVIFVTGNSGTEHELRGLRTGAVDFIAKPISEPLLLARVRTHLRARYLAEELRRMATTDALTGALNRRSLDEALAGEWARARRGGEPLSLLLVDVDHFKRFNDHYGHPAGDACLAAVAQALRTVTRRPADLVARYGGEEFALLLPHTPEDGALQVAQRALQAVAACGLPHAASPTAATVSISVGVATARPSADGDDAGGIAALVQAADAALYEAKRSGRARACVAGSP